MYRVLLCALAPLVLAVGQNGRDIEFARVGDVRLLMDANIPEGAGPFPAVIWVHGGGFVSGDKYPAPMSLLEPLSQQGYAWFSVNYRLAPQYPFPAATDDVEAAVAYIKAHAREYKIDPNRLVLTGASAGGHLVSFVGVKHRPENKVAAVIPFFGEHDLVNRVHPDGECMIDGKVVPNPSGFCLSPGLSKFLGITVDSPNRETVVRAASPVAHITKDMPPYLFIHGTKDLNVPYEQSVRMCTAMKKAGARCEVILVKGGGHGFGAWDKDETMAGYKPALLSWLKKQLH
jgi:alpha-L-fucosidase 2